MKDSALYIENIDAIVLALVHDSIYTVDAKDNEDVVQNLRPLY